MSYYQNLNAEEQGKVLSVMVGLKLNANRGQKVTREEVNKAFIQAVGKPLSLEYMRDPSVVQLMGLLAPERAQTGVYSGTKQATPRSAHTAAITDRNLASRGLPVPKTPSPPPMGATRYSASATGDSRFGR
jgi:hypothetical protein